MERKETTTTTLKFGNATELADWLSNYHDEFGKIDWWYLSRDAETYSLRWTR